MTGKLQNIFNSVKDSIKQDASSETFAVAVGIGVGVATGASVFVAAPLAVVGVLGWQVCKGVYKGLKNG